MWRDRWDQKNVKSWPPIKFLARVCSLHCFTCFPRCFDGSLRLILAAWHIFAGGDLNCPVEVGGDCLTQPPPPTNTTSNLISPEIKCFSHSHVSGISPISDASFNFSLIHLTLFVSNKNNSPGGGKYIISKFGVVKSHSVLDCKVQKTNKKKSLTRWELWVTWLS